MIMTATANISLYHYHKAGEVAAYIKLQVTERDKLSIDVLCKKYAIGESILTRSFKYRYKTTIHNFIIRERVAKATELMWGKRVSIKEIAHELGYHELNHLTRDFKKVLGMTPSQYKSQNCGRMVSERFIEQMEVNRS